MENAIGSNWKFHHVATIVKDMDEAVKYYESLGIFSMPPEFMLDSSTYNYYENYGQPSGAGDKTRMRFAQFGPFRIELVSPIAGAPIYREFQNDRGEGLHHIAFTVDNLEEETAKLTAKGVPVITKVRRANGTAFSYFDFRKIGGVVIELIQPAK